MTDPAAPHAPAGRLVAVVGPSGAGKDTLMRAVAQSCPALALVRRVITRPPDPGGEDYLSVTPAEFAAMRAAGAFLLDWHAHGLDYGVPRFPPGQGIALVNLSRAVLTQAARMIPGLRVIHVTARPEILAARLAARGREDPASVAARLARPDPPLPPGLPVSRIDNSSTLDCAVRAFLAALKETTP